MGYGNNEHITVKVDQGLKKEVDTLASELAQTSTQVLKNDQLSKRVTYDALVVKPSTYQAIVNNPSGVVYTNKPIGIYMSFKKGEVINEKRLKVTDGNGTEIPSQWEDDIHPRTYEIMGKYEDGSLKNGTLWIMSNLAIAEEKVFSVSIVSADTSYTDNIVGSVITANEYEKLTVGTTEFQIHKNASWGILKVIKDGVDLNGGTALQTTSVKNPSHADVNSSQTGNTNVISKKINGNGVVFKEIVSKFSYVHNSNIIATFRTRIWANGDVDWETRTETVAELAAGTLRGIMEKIQWTPISGATLDAHEHELYTAEIGSARKMLGGFRWSQRHGEYYDRNNYPLVVYNSTGKTYVGWADSNAPIMPNKAYWTNSAYVSFDFDSVSNERLRRINRLFTRATNENARTLKRKFSSLVKFYNENMRDWNLYNTGQLFPGLLGLESIGLTNMSGDDAYGDAVYFLDMALDHYGGGTQAGFVDSWKTTDWRRGIQYIGRDMAILPYIYNEAKKRNEIILVDKVLTVIHKLADAFVEIEGLSGGSGKVALRGDGTMASESDCMNSEATAIKFINLSLSFEENTVRRACMERIIARFNSTIQYNTRLPYALTENDTYYDFLINPRLHYHGFALFEYLQAVDNPPFDIRQLAFEVTNGTGQVKETGYDYQYERRGYASNSIYMACCLYKAGTISDLEQACKMVEYVIRHMYPSGGKQPIMDGWDNPSSPSSGSNLETQALIETILS